MALSAYSSSSRSAWPAIPFQMVLALKTVHFFQIQSDTQTLVLSYGIFRVHKAQTCSLKLAFFKKKKKKEENPKMKGDSSGSKGQTVRINRGCGATVYKPELQKKPVYLLLCCQHHNTQSMMQQNYQLFLNCERPQYYRRHLTKLQGDLRQGEQATLPPCVQGRGTLQQGLI